MPSVWCSILAASVRIIIYSLSLFSFSLTAEPPFLSMVHWCCWSFMGHLFARLNGCKSSCPTWTVCWTYSWTWCVLYWLQDAASQLCFCQQNNKAHGHVFVLLAASLNVLAGLSVGKHHLCYIGYRSLFGNCVIGWKNNMGHLFVLNGFKSKSYISCVIGCKHAAY